MVHTTQGRVEPGFLKDVQEHWSKFDTDQSHTISKAEFKKVMEELALQDCEASRCPRRFLYRAPC